jgi:hypothetical protein
VTPRFTPGDAVVYQQPTKRTWNAVILAVYPNWRGRGYTGYRLDLGAGTHYRFRTVAERSLMTVDSAP